MNNNEELHEIALQYALGTLPESESESFESHLDSDRELQDLVHEWQRVNEEDARDHEQLEPSFRILSTVMAEIEGGGKLAAKSAKSGSESKLVSFFSWGGWAAAAVFAVFLGLTIGEPLNSNETVAAILPHSGSDILLDDLGNPDLSRTLLFGQEQDEFQDRLLELTGLAESYWFSREGLPPEGGEGLDAEAFSGGFSIYDRKIKIGVIGIENIPEGRLGTYYNVWARVSEDRDPVWAGTLKSDDAGSRLAFFDLSSNATIKDRDEGGTFFVTEETEKHPERPKGRVVLSGI